MRKYTSETIIVTKEAWVFIRNCDRVQRGYKPLSDKFIENAWARGFRNGGANPATHPIGENEIRIDCDTCWMPLEEVKVVLENNGFKYRQDGFITEGIAL